MIVRHATRIARLPLRLASRVPVSSLSTLASRPSQPRLPAHCHARRFATPPPQLNHSDLSIQLYNQYSDATMDRLLSSLEDIVDQQSNPDFEVEYSSGVLTLKLGFKGTYVINKQPPNKQIWLSSPFSGPKRYDYSDAADDWIYSRDGRSLGDLLNQELSDALGSPVDLGLKDVSTQVS